MTERSEGMGRRASASEPHVDGARRSPGLDDRASFRLTDSTLRDGSPRRLPPVHRRSRSAAVARRPRWRRCAGDRGEPRRRARRLVVQLRVLAHRRDEPDRGGGRGGHPGQDRGAHAALGSAPRPTCGRPPSPGPRSPASPPTAPRPTSPSSTSPWPRELGMETVGFLMMAHMVEPDVLARAGQDHGVRRRGCVYVVDSAGAMTIDDARRRVAAVKAAARLARSASTPTTICRSPWPTRWPRSTRASTRSTAAPPASAPAPAIARPRS